MTKIKNIERNLIKINKQEKKIVYIFGKRIFFKTIFL